MNSTTRRFVTNVQLNLNEIRKHLKALYEYKPDELFFSIVTIDKKKKIHSRWFREINSAIEYIANLPITVNVYSSMYLSYKDHGPDNRCTLDDQRPVAGIVALFHDTDYQAPGHSSRKNYPPTESAAVQLVTGNSLDPTLLINSGHGIYPLLLFKEPWVFDSNKERLEAAALVRRYQQYIRNRAKKNGWDFDSTADLTRILRVAGTVNCKADPVLARILSFDDTRRYDPSYDIFDQVLPPDPGQCFDISNVEIRKVAKGLILRADAKPPTKKFEALRFNNELFAQSWEQNRPDLKDQSPSGYDQSLANYAAKAQWSDQEIADLMISCRRKHSHELHLKNKQKYARTILRARAQTTEPETPQEPSSENPLKKIVIESHEFLDLKIPERRCLLSPWLKEESINLISGWRGVGKSLYVLSICNAITSGEPMGPWQAETLVPCLYVDGEMATCDTQKRLRDLTPSGDRKAPLYVYSDAWANRLGLKRASLLSEAWRNNMKELMLELGVKLWVADNIGSLAPGIDENVKKDWDPINQWCLGLRFLGISTILIHHTGKEGQQRGTSSREDNIDISIKLIRPGNYVLEDGAMFVVKFTKARIPHEDLPKVSDLEFKWQIGANDCMTWTWRNVKKQNKIEILRMMDKGISQTDIAQTLGVTKSYVSQIKTEAIEKVLLSKKGKLTQTGFEYINAQGQIY